MYHLEDFVYTPYNCCHRFSHVGTDVMNICTINCATCHRLSRLENVDCPRYQATDILCPNCFSKNMISILAHDLTDDVYVCSLDFCESIYDWNVNPPKPRILHPHNNDMMFQLMLKTVDLFQSTIGCEINYITQNFLQKILDRHIDTLHYTPHPVYNHTVLIGSSVRDDKYDLNDLLLKYYNNHKNPKKLFEKLAFELV